MKVRLRTKGYIDLSPGRVRENPEIWYKWNEIYDGLKHNEGFEKWIFTDL